MIPPPARPVSRGSGGALTAHLLWYGALPHRPSFFFQAGVDDGGGKDAHGGLTGAGFAGVSFQVAFVVFIKCYFKNAHIPIDPLLGNLAVCLSIRL